MKSKTIKTETYIHIQAYPDAKMESVIKVNETRLIIHTKEPAKDNRANERIVELVHREFPGARVELISGHHSSNKTFRISHVAIK